MSQKLTQTPNSVKRSGIVKPRNRDKVVRKIGDYVKHLLICGEMSDVQFAVGRGFGTAKIFPAHRPIINVRSDVFRTMFYGSVPENCTVPIDIPDIHPDAFANMLGYMYTDTVENLRDDNAFQTLSCADKYGLPFLIDKCCRFIVSKLNIDSCLDILEKAVQYPDAEPSIMEIMIKCLLLIDQSAEAVWQSDRFCAISRETLNIILQRDTLAADEATIYSAVEKWATHTRMQRQIEASAANRREILGAALHLVRFPLFTDAQLLDGPAKTGLLLQSELWDIFHYKHAAIKPTLSFPTEARQNDERGEAVINFVVPDVRKLELAFTCSDPVKVRKMPWRIMVRVSSMSGFSWLVYYLKCGAYVKSASWRCQVAAELRLLPWKAETAPIKKVVSHAFSKKEAADGWGIVKYICMEDLLDPANGYVNPGDFSLKLQVHLTVALPTGTE